MLKVAPVPPPIELTNFLSFFGSDFVFSVKHPTNKWMDLSGTIHDVYNQLVALSKEGCEVYFMPSESANSCREITDIIAARAVFIDDDNVRGEPREDFLLKPSCIVETSAGKYHYYWHTVTSDLIKWAQVQESLIKIYDTDKAIKNVNRVMRLPGFEHKSGHMVEVVGGNKKIYEWSDIISAYPALPDTVEFKALSDATDIDEQLKIIREGKANTGLHKATRNYAWGMVNSGLPAKTIKATLRSIMSSYEGTARQLENLSKVDNLVDKAYEKYRKYEGSLAPRDIMPEVLGVHHGVQESNPIPENIFPKVFQLAAKEVAEWCGQSPSPAFICGITTVTALLSKNIVITELGNKFSTHAQTGAIIAMRSGTHKSSMYEMLTDPFFDYQTKLIKDYRDNASYAEVKIDYLSKLYKKKQRKTLSNEMGAAEIDVRMKELSTISDEIKSLTMVEPALTVADTTEERIVQLMAENDGVIFVVTDDGRNFVKNILGRYAKEGQESEGVMINGLTNTRIQYDRVRDSKRLIIDRPCLNVLVMIQPDKALQLKNSEMYQESGLAARMPIYFYPVSVANIAEATPMREPDMKKIQPFHDVIASLCIRRFDKPVNIQFSDTAQSIFTKYHKDIYVPLLKSQWSNHEDKVNKLITQCKIVSVTMAAIGDPEFAKVLKTENEYIVNGKYANMGISYIRSLYDQFICNEDVMDDEIIIKSAKRFLSALYNKYQDGTIYEGFTDGTYLQNVFHSLTKDNQPAVLNLLLEKGWLVYSTRGLDAGKGYLNSTAAGHSKMAKPGDKIFHLNLAGIKKLGPKGLQDMRIDIRLEAK